jgi:hypothetical protein
MRSLTAERVTWRSRGSSSIVEVAPSLAAFVGVLCGVELENDLVRLLGSGAIADGLMTA